MGGDNDPDNGSKDATAQASFLPEQIFSTPPLTHADEQRLIRLAKRGDKEARNQLVMANMSLVASIARKYAFRSAEFDDLVHDGVFGLIRAIEKYNFTKGKKFSTYAFWWVARYIRRASRENGRLIILPDYLETRARRIWAVESELRMRLGRRPETEEIAELTRLTPEKVRYLFSISLDSVSLDCPVSEDTGISLGDLLEDELAERPEHLLERAEFVARVRAAVKELDSRSARVIRLRYGIIVGRRHGLPEIGRLIGKTRQRANQIELTAIARLKKIMKNKEFNELYNE